MKTLLIIIILLYGLPVFGLDVEVLSSTVTYDIESTSAATISYYKKVKIHNKKGYNQGIYVGHYSQFTKVTGLSLIIYDVNGNRIKKYKKGDALDYNFNPSYEIDDTRTLVIDHQYQSYPYLVEIEYQVKYRGFISFPAWYPLAHYNTSVKHTKLTLSHPQDLVVNLALENGLPEPEVTMVEGKVQKSIELKDIEPVQEQIFELPLHQTQPHLLIATEAFEIDGYQGSLASWQTFGDWFYQLNEGRGGLTSSTKKVLDRIQANSHSKEEIVRKVFEYMQGRTRYVSIQLGIGGWQSLTSAYVDANGYGDCKALTNYMREMLRHLKIKSNFVLVRAGKDAPYINSGFPSNQFNHVFLAIPNEQDTIWLECTDQQMPPNYLGSFTDGREVLWIAKGASEILKTPGFKPSENLITQDLRIELSEDGNALCHLDIRKKGVFYNDIAYYQYLDNGRRERYNYERFSFPSYQILDQNHKDNRDSLELVEYFDLQVNNLARNNSGRLILKTNLMDEVAFIPPSTEGAGNVAHVRRGSTTRTHCRILVPENYGFRFNSPYGEVESKAGFYRLNIKHEKGALIIERELLLNDGLYKGEDFLELKSFLDEVRKMDHSKIMVTDKT